MTLDEILRLPGPGDFLPPPAPPAWEQSDAEREALAIRERCRAFVQRFADTGVDDLVCAMERSADEIWDALPEPDQGADWREDQDADLRIRERLQECG